MFKIAAARRLMLELALLETEVIMLAIGVGLGAVMLFLFYNSCLTSIHNLSVTADPPNICM